MNRFAILGVGIGVFASTSVLSLMSGLQGETRDRILNAKPHLLWESKPTENLLPTIQKLSANKEKIADMVSIHGILQTEALLELSERNEKGRAIGSGIILRGDDAIPNDEFSFGVELFSHLSPGRTEKMKIKSVWNLSKAPLVVTPHEIFETGIFEIDRTQVRTSRETLALWLGLGDAVSRIEVRVKNPENDLSSIKNQLQEQLGVSFNTWKEIDSALWYSLRLEKIVMGLVVFFVFFIALLALNLAMSVRVVEKTREMALLRGLGARDEILKRMFFIQGTIMGSFGGLLGLGLGWLFCYFLSEFGSLPSIYYSTRIPADWNWGVNFLIFFVAVAFSAFVSYFPSEKVCALEINEALRS